MEDSNNQLSSNNSLQNNLPQDNLSPLPPLPPESPKPSAIPEVPLSEVPVPKIPSSFVPQTPQPPQSPVTPPFSESSLPSSSPLPPLPEKRKSSNFLKVLVVIIVLLLVGVGAFGAVLYARVYDPVWSPFRPSPEQVLQNMMQNMQNVKTVNSQTKLNLSTDDARKINIDFGGIFDVTDKLNPKSSMKVGIVSNFALGDSFTTSTTVLGENPAVPFSDDSLKAEVMVVDKNSYFKISEMNVPSYAVMFYMFGVDPSKIIGNWIKVPQDMQNNITSKDSIATRDLTEEEMTKFTEKMQKVISENNIFIVKEELSDKVINGEKMYNYVLVINNDNLLKVFGEIMQESINMQNNLQEDKLPNSVSPYMLGAMKGAMKEVLDKIGEIKINTLIGKKDNLLYGFDILKTIDLADLTNGEMQGKIDILVQSVQSDFNKLVNITAPTTFKSIEEVFPIEEFIK